MTKVQLPEIVVGDKNNKYYKNDVIILICGEERFDKRLHEQVIEKITQIFPYDYLVFNPEDTEEYLKLHPAEIQMWKYYDTVEVLPDKYSFIIRFRNDINWNENFVPTWDIFREAYAHGLTVGIQSFNYRRVLHNETRKQFIGDLIVFHTRNVLKNPRKNPSFVNPKVREKKLTWESMKDFCPHRAWFEMFDPINQRCHYNADIRLYRQPEILKIWPKGLMPPDFGDEE